VDISIYSVQKHAGISVVTLKAYKLSCKSFAGSGLCLHPFIHAKQEAEKMQIMF